MQKVLIEQPFIKLGQLLKMMQVIGSGGEAKVFLAEVPVTVNGQLEQRRGRKCYPGDVIHVATEPPKEWVLVHEPE